MLTACLIHALPPGDRLGFNRREAASRIGVSVGHFDKLVREGLVPPPVNLLGRKVWHRDALDRVLDGQLGIDSTGRARSKVGDDDDLDRELEAFEAKNGYA